MLKSIRSVKNLSGKRVLLRADLNVPIKNGIVLEDFKIIRILPTLRFLLRYKCKVILITHLGEPEPGFDHRFSVEPIAARMEELLGKKIAVNRHIRGLRAGSMVGNMKEGDILFFENIRFEKGEKENDPQFASELAALAQIFVNDAFAVSHRAHASVAGIRRFLPSYAGLLMEKELVNMKKALNPKRPLVLMVGGAKIKTKISLLNKYKKKAEKILIGGALANTFLAARGFEVGKSLHDKDSLDLAKNLNTDNILLPLDLIVSSKANGGKTEIKSASKILKSDYIFDIGPRTIKLYSGYLKSAKTIIWNGPMGMFEIKDFRHGTLALARTVAGVSTGKAFGIVGGGETVEALKITGMQNYIDWISTGGGAMLSYLGGEKMPGLS
jgi:phosphoglycerate kinase